MKKYTSKPFLQLNILTTSPKHSGAKYRLFDLQEPASYQDFDNVEDLVLFIFYKCLEEDDA